MTAISIKANSYIKRSRIRACRLLELVKNTIYKGAILDKFEKQKQMAENIAKIYQLEVSEVMKVGNICSTRILDNITGGLRLSTNDLRIEIINKVFESFPDTDRKKLIIFGYMIHESIHIYVEMANSILTVKQSKLN